MKTLSVSAKCSDMFSAVLHDDKRGVIGEHAGYVPDWFPNYNVRHYGDYVVLDIDVETGRILNWVKPNEESLSKTFGK